MGAQRNHSAQPVQETSNDDGSSRDTDLESNVNSSITLAATPDAVQPRGKIASCCRAVASFFLDQWFIIVLGLLIAFSSQVQVPAAQQGKREIVVTYLCVAVIFIITGCTLPTKVLLDNYSRWKVHLFVQLQSFLMTSAIAFGIVSACSTNRDFMDPGLLVGIIFTGCVPTTISSNIVMTRQAHGNTALTVVQSTVGNFLGPFLSPLLISLYTSTGAWYTDILPKQNGGYDQIYRRVFMQLGLSIFLPMIVGQLIQKLFPQQTKKLFIDWKLSKLSSFSLLVIIWQTFDQAFASGAFTSVKSSNIIFIVGIAIVLFFVWLAVAFILSILWLPKTDTIAVCYCVPAKTPAMGVPLSNVMFLGLTAIQGSKIQIPMVIFQGLQIMAGSLLTIAFRRWIGPDEEKDRIEEKPSWLRQAVSGSRGRLTAKRKERI